MQRSDHDLIRQIQAQDAAAFEVLFVRYRTPIQRHVQSIVRDHTAGDDLVQEVFLRVWTRAEQWDDHGSVKAWLYRIATNLALNYLRTVRRRPQQTLEARLVDESGSEEEISAPGWLVDAAALEPPAVVEAAEQVQRLQKLVEELPEEKREVFRLVYDAEMDLRSVADQLGIPEGTVKSRLYYSKRYLMERWEQNDGE
ncbi:MAG: hypothetical protein DCC55_23085 [Chloroflexi bacterium]|nr:MAG: hypothetical protein DCC55_23085 [Chloroflexota bacterium]